MEAEEAIVSEDGVQGNFAIQRKGGRPPFEVTDENRDLVTALTVNGVTAEDVADTLGISEPTLLKYFREELTHGRKNANARVAKSLFRRAIKAEDSSDKGAVTAAIFWLKTRAGWKEEQAPQAPGTVINVVQMLDDVAPELLRALREAMRAKLMSGGQAEAFAAEPSEEK